MPRRRKNFVFQLSSMATATNSLFFAFLTQFSTYFADINCTKVLNRNTRTWGQQRTNENNVNRVEFQNWTATASFGAEGKTFFFFWLSDRDQSRPRIQDPCHRLYCEQVGHLVNLSLLGGVFQILHLALFRSWKLYYRETPHFFFFAKL